MILQFLISVIIICPVLLLFIVYYFCRKRKMRESKAFGWASDVTTFILFFSVPLLISSLWQLNISIYIICFAIIIAMIFTYFDWKKKKEIEILPLLKKIWRFFFLFLMICYIIIWIIGMLHYIIVYVFYT